MTLEVSPIGIVRSDRAEVVDDNWGSVESVIDLDRTVLDVDATLGLADFSHLEVVYGFHRCDPAATTTGSRHPRGDSTLPRVGVLAQRVKDRPNHLGVSRCEIVDVDGLRIRVRGLDAIDGSPVLDVKPFLQSMVPERADVTEPAWVASVMKNYF
ncbi:tRNA (N6-threonylcarbamoyladenosine(37)-N6)-methyltransferase TrmO [Rhodococcus sp. 06-412-2C]|uniref:TrmO family methyltransferase domain-containing protein n=1 Tax=unclassified Rhodococcus (in: high G+C Gram-positive bacteria) TaxID=192944 RepID=UPI000B9B2657|nr:MULTISPECIES: TrmO family methyltransferase [unclassified Rhodococcus (in: high G+C Gram-positive bacteria)]OZC86554.1 tRNA (N6-threonylcarbamoyladenosine(37)-N6)-methyltransferase TrmO [Rhodococcus sp. 06-412-2C]OZD02254.1 tRNA (N6-threonylcarbamoyladenosine(37)-N6)-methyltransferase TrmO [Rhodococcus sp. 06-412-2B]